MAGLYGDLSVMSLADVLIWLGNREQSGVLALRQDNAFKEIEIEAGRVVRCASSLPRERLGQFLLAGGHVTETQLQRAYQAQEETQVLLGRILVMIGLVPEPQVAAVLAEKIRETVLESIRHVRGEFRFDQRPPDRRRPEVDAAVHLVEIHRLAAARAARWEVIHRVIPSVHVGFSVDERAWPVGRPMDALTQRLLLLAKTGLTVEAMLGEVQVPEFAIFDQLASLLELGVIDARSPASVDPQRVPPGHAAPTHEGGPIDPDVDLFGLIDAPPKGADPLVADPPLDEFDRELERALKVARRSQPPPPPAPSGPQAPAGVAPSGLLGPPSPASGPLLSSGPSPASGPLLSSGPAPASGPLGVGGGTGPLGGRRESRPSDAATRGAPSQRPTRTAEQRDVLVAMVPQHALPLEALLSMVQSARERYVLSSIDGARNVGEILQVIPMPADEALDAFESLARTGLIVMGG